MSSGLAMLEPSEIRKELHLSYEKMGHILDVSSKTIQRWEKEKRRVSTIKPEYKVRLAKIKQILDLGSIVYTPEGLNEFLGTPLPEFSNRTALQLMESGYFDEIISALASDYEGLGY